MASWGRNIGVTVGLASLLVGPGCKQLLGLHERGELVEAGTEGTEMPDAESPDVGADRDHPNPAVGQCGSQNHPSQACADCVDRNCCAEATACHDDPSCSLESDCLFQCGDDGACRARCIQFYNRSEPLLAESACREKSCSTECRLSCGGFGYNAVPGCDTCIQSKCCQVAFACAKNFDCLALDRCRTNCLPGSISCPPQCDTTYPKGTNDYGAWLDCLQNDNACGPKCQSGRNWQCLGTSIVWPKPKGAAKFTFSVTIVDLLSENPYAGALVKACNKFDALCASPIDQQMTDGEGLVSLTVPAGSSGFNGYLDITGGDKGGGANGAPSPIFPALSYPVPPIISPGWRGRLQFVSAADLPVLGALTKAEIDPTRGHFAANALDCNLTAAGGVSFSADTADDKTRSFYFVNGLPSISGTATDPQSAIGGFVNLPGGRLVLITAMTVEGGKKVGSLTFHIRPGSFTTTSFPPTP
jgi:hypothetical protein